jgi:hydrogenase-4 component B
LGVEGFFLFFSGGLFAAGILAFAVFAREKSILENFYFLFASGSVFAGVASLLMIGADTRLFAVLSISGFLEFNFETGPLSGFFALVLSILALAVSIYSTDYARDAEHPLFQGTFYGLFIVSIYAVFFAANIFTFMVAWELMSLVSYFLVVGKLDEKSRKAGFTYFTMTHLGTALILAGFLITYFETGSMDFEGIRAGLAGKPDGVRSLIFVLSFLGFGVKAGIVPLHIWLPRAHPAAPSNVSALMSGIMIKTGIFGIVKMGIHVLGGNIEWWGILVLIVGMVSSVLGVLYALMEHDLKRLLAYHSVENIGIILLGVGASIVFYANGQYPLAGLALAAGLYHTLNHALFKGLLFIGAGSVLKSTGIKDMEQMGGLLKLMPRTGFFFLVGAVSICALPPFNGFVSEWLTFQSLILGSTVPHVYSQVASVLGGAALALTGALAAACFIKVFGISFLGLARSEAAREAKESPIGMNTGMAVLAFFCFIFGIFPGSVLSLLSDIPVASLSALKSAHSGSSIIVKGGFARVSPWGLLILGLLALLPAFTFLRSYLIRKKIRYGDSWDCGMKALTPRMQYTATGFAKPLRLIFKNIYLPTKEIKITYLIKPFFVKSIVYKSGITPFFEKYGYEPIVGGVHKVAGQVRKLQSGSLHLYLGYILITLIVLLLLWGA